MVTPSGPGSTPIDGTAGEVETETVRNRGTPAGGGAEMTRSFLRGLRSSVDQSGVDVAGSSST